MPKGSWIPVRGAQGVHSRQAHADRSSATRPPPATVDEVMGVYEAAW